MNSFLRFINTLRYLKLTQLWARFTWILKTKVLKPFFVRKTVQYKAKFLLSSVNRFDLRQKPVFPPLYDQNLSGNRFKFLNQEVFFQAGTEWNSRNYTKLWLYHLHYFDYLIPLTHHPGSENFDVGKKIISNWMRKNPLGKGVGWEPYPLSLRIVNWIFFYDAYYGYFRQDGVFNNQFLQNLSQQSYYLSRFIEYHLQANHLFENAKSLVSSSVFFQNVALFNKSIKLLRREIHKQILPDGGHFERSPMYHLQILLGLLDTLNVLSAIGKMEKYPQGITRAVNSFLPYLKAVISRMISWSRQMCHPDGDVAMFGDSALKTVPELSLLLKYYQELDPEFIEPTVEHESTALPDSGYYIFRYEPHYLVVDGGELGATYQPGHAHCDFLSFEYSYRQQRFIVDSGLGEYQPTALRQQARGIYSHNTVVVNRLEQAEIWKVFRMGRRIKPGETGLREEDGRISFTGQYVNALERKLIYRHRRSIHFCDHQYFFIHDQVEGSAIQTVENLIHIHPECKLTANSEEIRLKQAAEEICILWNKKNMSMEFSEWFYVPEFGKVEPAQVIIFKPQIDKVVNMYYVITPLIFRDQARLVLNALTKR